MTGKSVMHWMLRAMAVCLGFIFLVFGGLFLVAWLAGVGQGANPPPAAVKIVVTVMFAIVTLFGMVLLWLGFRRWGVASAAETKLVDVPVHAEAIPAASGTYCEATAMRTAERCQDVRAEPATAIRQPAPRGPSEHRSAGGELGQFIARCGPEKNGETYNYVSAGIYLLLGLGCVLAPMFMDFRVDPGLAAKIALIPAGIGVAAALMFLWGPLFGAPQTIELYEHGIVERLGKQVRQIELAAIEHLRLQEWYEHRFADRTFNVKARVRGQRQLAFNTALRGEGDSIIQYLASQFPDAELVEFDATL